MKFYVASKASNPERGKMWREFRAAGADIVSTWIDEDGPKQTRDYVEFWSRIDQEITQCDRLILYVEAGDRLKGALIEVGMALARGKKVCIIAHSVDSFDFKTALGTWWNHPFVVSFARTADFLTARYLLNKALELC